MTDTTYGPRDFTPTTPDVQLDQTAFDAVNAQLAQAGYPFKFGLIPTDQLDFLEKNARFMEKDTFDNLTSNIQKDGGLSSTPFLHLQENGRYKVLSGNHRSQAAIEAGHRFIVALYTDQPMTHSEQVARQLSHNAIEGKDDPIILKSLWEEIDDLGLKYYAGLNDKTLKTLEEVSLKPLSEAPLEFKTVAFLFLPHEHERLANLFDAARKAVPSKELHLVPAQTFDRFIRDMGQAQKNLHIINSATALGVILDVFERHITDLSDHWPDEPKKGQHVPFSSTFGTEEIPLPTAKVVKKALAAASKDTGTPKSDVFAALETICRAYLERDTGAPEQAP